MGLTRLIYTNSIFLILFLSGCETKNINSKASFVKWMGNKKNGLIKENTANNFTLLMKYLPPEYLAMNEMFKSGGINVNSYNKFLEEFKSSRTFLLIIKHNNRKVDITNYNVTNMQEYNKRIADLNFRMKDVIRLKTSEGTEFLPLLSTVENTYEIGALKSIYLVFSGEKEELLNSKTFDIIFNGNFLHTGINHFVFEKKNIDNIPTLTFIN